jgi:hypothetical protein
VKGVGRFQIGITCVPALPRRVEMMLIGLILLKYIELKSSVFQPPFQKGSGINMAKRVEI